MPTLRTSQTNSTAAAEKEKNNISLWGKPRLRLKDPD